MATGIITITPAITFTPTTNVTHAELNQAASPQGSIPAGAIGTTHLDTSDVKNGLGVVGENYFLNPNFSAVRWTRGTSPVSCPAGSQTYRADDWWANPTGAAVTYERVQAGPDALSLHSAQLTGASSVTTVDFGQDIASHIATALAAPIVVSLYLYNNTGASLTPTLRIDTPATADDFSSVTNRYVSASSTAGATAQWTRHTWVLDASAFANMANGARVYVRLPSGSMTAGNSVRIAQAKIERGTQRTAFVVPLEEAETTDTTTSMVADYLENPGFHENRWISGGNGVATVANTDVYNAEGWFCNADSATATYARDTSVPDSLSYYAAKILSTGATGACRFGQNIEQGNSTQLRRNVTFSIYIYNGSTADFTPSLILATPAVVHDFANAIVRVTAAMQLCPAGVWTRVSYTFNGSTVTAIANGLRLYVSVPSGHLDNTESVSFATAQLIAGLAPSDYAPAPRSQQRAMIAQARGVVLDYVNGASFTYAVAEAVLLNEANESIVIRGASGTVTMTTSGADGLDTGTEGNAWYHVWCISTGTTHKALVSLSASAPTMPPGYRYRARIGIVYNDSGNNLVAFTQRDLWWSGPRFNLFTPATITTTLTAKNNTLIPPTAIRAIGFGGTQSAHDAHLAIAPLNSSFVGAAQIDIAQAVGNYNSFYASAPFNVQIYTAQTVYVAAASAMPTYAVMLHDFVLS